MPLAVQYAISLLEFVLVVFSILRTAFYESCIYLVSDCFILRREECSGPYLYDAWRFMSTFCPTQGEFYSAIYNASRLQGQPRAQLKLTMYPE